MTNGWHESTKTGEKDKKRQEATKAKGSKTVGGKPRTSKDVTKPAKQ